MSCFEFSVLWLMKRIFDFFVAAAGLILLSPLLLVVAVLIKLDSPGPVLFKQQRIGKQFRLNSDSGTGRSDAVTRRCIRHRGCERYRDRKYRRGTKSRAKISAHDVTPSNSQPDRPQIWWRGPRSTPIDFNVIGR